MALELDPGKTALVLIDLQMGILSGALAPHDADTVVSNGVRAARALAEAGGIVVRVNVAFAPGLVDRPQGKVDAAVSTAAPVSDYSAFHPDVAALNGAISLTKRQWGAFHDNGLDSQLRRRGVDTILLGGVATNFGVEGTAREAWARNYSVVVIEDASTSMSAEMHAFSIRTVLPRIARIRSTADVLTALGAKQ